MRIVLDANIFIGALISGDGYPGQLLAAVKRERITSVTSIYQIEELRDVLGRERLKPYIRPAEAEDLVYHLEAVGMVTGKLPEMSLSPDPKDNPILATAVAGEADLLVSGDKGDMLALGHVEGIPIVTARDVVGRLRKREGRQ